MFASAAELELSSHANQEAPSRHAVYDKQIISLLRRPQVVAAQFSGFPAKLRLLEMAVYIAREI